MCGLCCNAASCNERGITHSKGEQLYFCGRPFSQGNIAGLINSSRGRNTLTNCAFVECKNGHELEHISRDVPRYILVYAVRSLRVGDELFVNYGWRRRTPAPLED